jgi:hypothetical protein
MKTLVDPKKYLSPHNFIFRGSPDISRPSEIELSSILPSGLEIIIPDVVEYFELVI